MSLVKMRNKWRNQNLEGDDRKPQNKQDGSFVAHIVLISSQEARHHSSSLPLILPQHKQGHHHRHQKRHHNHHHHHHQICVTTHCNALKHLLSGCHLKKSEEKSRAKSCFQDIIIMKYFT